MTDPAISPQVSPKDIEVIAPNFKRRLSGVTATVVRLVPVQSREIGIVAIGPVLPAHVPQIPLLALLTLPRKPMRVWHARRNVEMIGGLALKYLLGKHFRLMFTSASQRRQSGLTRWLIRRMDAVVATSDKTAGYLEGPATVIMHGIDTDTFTPAPDRAALRARMGLPADGPLIGCYGRIRAQKGTDAFVHAMIEVLRAHPTAHAIVMGRAVGEDQRFVQTLKDAAKRAGVAAHIHFKPEVPTDAMADWYAALDLYVAPQRWEGFGLTPLEAMATGCPVIATRVGAFEQLVVEGVTGTLVPPDDIPALARAIGAALADPKTAQQWREDARAHVTQNFSIASEAQSLIALYRSLLR
jgi:mannosyltransferase